MKGTFRGHLMTMIKKQCLWTTQIKPERLVDAIKEKTCFSYDSMNFKQVSEDNDNEMVYQLTFDFGDMVVYYTITFTKSKGTNRWVFSKIE